MIAKLADGFQKALKQLRQEKENWIFWLPVGIGLGIVLYFALPEEPDIRTSGSFLSLSAVGAYLSLHRPRYLLTPFVALLVVATGFIAAHYRTWSVADAPTLREAVGPTWVRGEIAEIEKQTSGYRVYLDDVEIWRYPEEKTPRKVRLNVRTSISGAGVGDFIAVRARLTPPPGPVYPGAYDFARWTFFEQIGGVGYTLGAFEIREEATQRGTALNHLFARLRATVAERIAGHFAGEEISREEGIAVALLTGEKGLIQKDVLEAMRHVGLGHLLAISGLHLALVTALGFFVLRAVLALIPAVALHHNIKKWSAAAALIIGLGYLLLTGSPVSAQRAFIMVGLFLLAILIDRVGSPMRPVVWAALIILLLTPETLLGPSFQMSFAATIALIAAYHAAPRRSYDYRERTRFGLFLYYTAGVVLSSVVAGLATTPYAIYHFGNVAPYSLPANMVAIPLTSFLVMPAGLLGLLLMPLGLDYLPFQLMGAGIAMIVGWSDFIHALPEAHTVVPSISTTALALITVGGLWLCFWRKPVRRLGLWLILAGLVAIPLTHEAPDIVVDKDARLFALRDAAGEYYFSDMRRARFARTVWTQKFGLESAKKIAHYTPRQQGDVRIEYDNSLCLYVAGEYRALILQAEEGHSVNEDAIRGYCPDVDVFMNLSGGDNLCKTVSDAVFISRQDLYEKGAHLIRFRDGGVRIETVKESRGKRPWTGNDAF